jgi:hypothetical protein
MIINHKSGYGYLPRSSDFKTNSKTERDVAAIFATKLE